MTIDLGGQHHTGIDLSKVVRRGQNLDLGGAFEIPPGDPVSHFGAGLAKVLASNVFLSGLELDFAQEHVGYFTAPYESRHHVVAVDQDTQEQAIAVELDNGVTRVARMFQSQGAICLPLNSNQVFFEPSTVVPDCHAQQQCQWPDKTVPKIGRAHV